MHLFVLFYLPAPTAPPTGTDFARALNEHRIVLRVKKSKTSIFKLVLAQVKSFSYAGYESSSK